MSKLSKVFAVIVFIGYLFLVLVGFNPASVEFTLQDINLVELHSRISSVYFGLGVLLFIQPMLAIIMLVYLKKPLLTGRANKALCIYVGITVAICFIVFAYTGQIPWFIPTAS
jgi:hypothetical protein